MKQITIKTYSFDELSEEAKKKAIEKYADINTDDEWYEYLEEDAENIGIQITDFDIYRYECNGKLKTSALESIEKVLKEHGKTCETYKIALKHKAIIERINCGKESEDQYYDAVEDYLTDMLAAYLTMLQEDYEYKTSEEAIIETIEANDYQFTEEGNTSVYL